MFFTQIEQKKMGYLLKRLSEGKVTKSTQTLTKSKAPNT
jgi:hypothetical protein